MKLSNVEHTNEWSYTSTPYAFITFSVRNKLAFWEIWIGLCVADR